MNGENPGLNSTISNHFHYSFDFHFVQKFNVLMFLIYSAGTKRHQETSETSEILVKLYFHVIDVYSRLVHIHYWFKPKKLVSAMNTKTK